MQSTIDMPVNDFKSVFSALLQSLDNLKVSKDYRISFLCYDGSIDVDVYPSDSSPLHLPDSFKRS